MAFPNTFANVSTATGAQLDANFNALSANNGSSLVGFLQSGTGAVARNVQSKSRDIVSVLDFGAVGNGIADDTASIQAAINWAQTLGGADVNFAPGTYNVTSTLSITGNNVRLVGQSLYAVTIYRNFTTGPTIAIGGVSDARTTGNGVVGLTFSRNLALTPDVSNVANIRMTSADTGFIRDVEMYSTVEGIQLIGGNSIWLSNINMSATYSQAGGARYGINLKKCATVGTGTAAIPTSTSIDKVWVSGTSVHGGINNGGFGYPLWINAGESVSITNSYFGQGHFYSVLIEQGSDDANILDFKFTGNYIDAANAATGAGYGMYITGSGVNSAYTWNATSRTGGSGAISISNLQLTNDTIKGQGGDGLDGIYVDGTPRAGTFVQALNGLHITGCTIAAWSRNGVNLAGGIGTVISGSTINGNNYLNTLSGNGVVIGAASVGTNITSNLIGGDAFSGTYTLANYQLAGVNVVSGATNYTIVGNDLANNAGYSIYDAGGAVTKMIYNNVETNRGAAYNASGLLSGIPNLTVTDSSSSGTVATVAGNWIGRPTLIASLATTYTDAFTQEFSGGPIASTNVTVTRPHTLGILDSTTSSSSITGGLVVATTFGTSATSVGIGGGNVYAGGLINSPLIQAINSVGVSNLGFYNSGNSDNNLGTATTTLGGLIATSIAAPTAFTYTDGIVIDYTTGTGRISVGGSDGIGFYTGGIGSSIIASISSAGIVSAGAAFSGPRYQTTATGRAVQNTAAQATATIAAGIASTYIATPAANITVTLAAPTGDGERRRIVFGAATTVTWSVTAPATSAVMKTSFAAGETIEVVYNSVAGTPTNSAATTWYTY